MNHDPAARPAFPDGSAPPVPTRCAADGPPAPERPGSTLRAVAVALTLLGAASAVVALLAMAITSAVVSTISPPPPRMLWSGEGPQAEASPSVVELRAAPAGAVVALPASPSPELPAGLPAPSAVLAGDLAGAPAGARAAAPTAAPTTVTAPPDVATAPSRTVPSRPDPRTPPTRTAVVTLVASPSPAGATGPTGTAPAGTQGADGTIDGTTVAWWLVSAAVLCSAVGASILMVHRRSRRHEWRDRLDAALDDVAWFTHDLVPDLALAATAADRLLLWNQASPRLRDLEARLTRLTDEAQEGTRRARVATLADAVRRARGRLEQVIAAPDRRDVPYELRRACDDVETALAAVRQPV